MGRPGSHDVTTRELTITRVFDAPRELVWQAWTDPAQIACWWGKRGWTTPPASVTIDLRPGGVFRLNSINDDDGAEMPFDTVFCEVVEPERLTWGENGEAVVTFADLGDGRTEMTFDTTVEMSEHLRDRAKGGMESAFDRLAEHLTAGNHRNPRSHQ